jgi:hypothetical protein
MELPPSGPPIYQWLNHQAHSCGLPGPMDMPPYAVSSSHYYPIEPIHTNPYASITSTRAIEKESYVIHLSLRYFLAAFRKQDYGDSSK